jgi:hypothetical protein
MIIALPICARRVEPGPPIIRVNPPPPAIISISKLSDTVDWSSYVEPGDFAGYDVRYSTVAGEAYDICPRLYPTPIGSSSVPLTDFPSTAVECLVEPVDTIGQHGEPAARVGVTGGPPSGSYPSGLAWMSGLSPNGDVSTNLSNVTVWGTWRRRSTDVVNIKAPRGGNPPPDLNRMVNGITGRSAEYAALYTAHVRISQVVPITPNGGPTLVQCNAGDADSAHTTIANWLAARQKRTPFIIRLGHEMDDLDNRYSPGNDPDQVGFSNYKGAFQRIANIYKTALGGPPDFYIDWCHLRTPRFNPDSIYPGAAYVHIIGADVYYNTSAVDLRSQADFAAFSMKTTGEGWPAGPGAWLAYARGKGKKFGIGEWAVTNDAGAHSLYDNPYYIKGMFDLIAAHASDVIYECYFNTINNHILLNNSGTAYSASGVNPDAAAQYATSWRPLT